MGGFLPGTLGGCSVYDKLGLDDGVWDRVINEFPEYADVYLAFKVLQDISPL